MGFRVKGLHELPYFILTYQTVPSQECWVRASPEKGSLTEFNCTQLSIIPKIVVFMFACGCSRIKPSFHNISRSFGIEWFAAHWIPPERTTPALRAFILGNKYAVKNKRGYSSQYFQDSSFKVIYSGNLFPLKCQANRAQSLTSNVKTVAQSLHNNKKSSRRGTFVICFCIVNYIHGIQD